MSKKTKTQKVPAYALEVDDQYTLFGTTMTITNPNSAFMSTDRLHVRAYPVGGHDLHDNVTLVVRPTFKFKILKNKKK